MAKEKQATSSDVLRLENQLCFRLYAASKEVVRRYRPHLEPLGLTYTQYITMMALWEEESLSMKELGARLDLESSTLTPLVKKLETAGLVTRQRSTEDERSTVVGLTQAGRDLHDKALSVPACMADDLAIDTSLGLQLIDDLDELLQQLRTDNQDR